MKEYIEEAKGNSMPKNCSECQYQDGCERCFGGLGCRYWKQIEEEKYRNRKKDCEKTTILKKSGQPNSLR